MWNFVVESKEELLVKRKRIFTNADGVFEVNNATTWYGKPRSGDERPRLA